MFLYLCQCLPFASLQGEKRSNPSTSPMNSLSHDIVCQAQMLKCWSKGHMPLH